MSDWKSSLATAVLDLDELLSMVGLERGQLPELADDDRRFPLRVSREYVRRMVAGDPADPLLRQVLPLRRESEHAAGFTIDPLGECRSAADGVLRKYAGRSLLVVSGTCAVHCRYCFRRHYPYAEATVPRTGWEHAISSIEHDPSCREVILSGGDPLALDDRLLAPLAAGLARLPQVQRLRLHTRLPVVIPSRVNDQLLAWLATGRLQPVVVVHANHAHEIDSEVAAAMGKLRAAGVTLLNQSVLLAGVNDSADALCELSETLFAAGVLPYYLHCLDRVQGAEHFEVEDDVARSLVRAVRERLPGYLVPRLVRELPGQPAKLPLND